jgi:ubiquitin-protein ligase
MDKLFQIIDTLNFDDIFQEKVNKIHLIESVIKRVTLENNKNISEQVVNMLWNEICNINNLKNIHAEPKDNNLLKFNIKLKPMSEKIVKHYDGDILITIKVSINYPNSPHIVNIKHPKFINNLNYNIKFSEYFKDIFWNPTNSIEYTIKNVQNIIEEHGILSENLEFIELENNLEKLSILSHIKPNQYNPITIHNIPIKKNNNNNNLWASGTGYGNNQSINWDLENYLLIEKKKNIKIIKYLNKIFNSKKININIVNNSCLFQYIIENLFGIQILDIIENFDKFLIIFKIIKNFNFIIDDKLNNILYELKIKLKNYIELLEKNNELSEIDKIKELYFNYLKSYKKKINISDNNDIFIEIFKGIQFDSYPLYEKQLIKDKPRLLNIKRVLQEIQSLSNSLPLNQDSSIFLKYDEENLGIFRFIIIGPKDTPYENGCFLFEMILTEDYPNSAPKVHILTTGNGTVRFNPNLYACGKVCLSLLGTWQGSQAENWNPKTSTLLQILVSIQSLIFIDNPYFNEPGYERSIHTEKGKQSSNEYNDKIKLYTKQWAINGMIKNPPEDFQSIIQKFFEFKNIKL